MGSFGSFYLSVSGIGAIRPYNEATNVEYFSIRYKIESPESEHLTPEFEQLVAKFLGRKVKNGEKTNEITSDKTLYVPPNHKILREKMGSEDSVTVLSALLDFYADRAAAFASLFVASIFGLVTLSALIQNYSGNNFLWYIIAGVPYIAFVLSGYFTWMRFRYWADLAHNLEFYGLSEPYKSELKKIDCVHKEGNENKVTDFYSYAEDMHKKQNNSRVGKFFVIMRRYFSLFYLLLIIFLTIIVYWSFLVKLFEYVGYTIIP